MAELCEPLRRRPDGRRPSPPPSPKRMNPATVLYLSPTAQLGGAEHSLLDLAGGLDLTRFSARIVCLGTGPLIAAAESRGIPVEGVDLPQAFERVSLRGHRTGVGRM